LNQENLFTLVMYPPIEWGGLFQRPQHLAREFCRKLGTVIYIQPAGLRNPSLLDLKRIRGFCSSTASHPSDKMRYKGLIIKTLPFIPLHGLALTEAINAAILDRFILRLKNKQAPCILWAAAPAPFFAKSTVVQGDFPLIFDWLDDYAIFRHLPGRVTEMQYELAAKADLVFASSKTLLKKAKQHGAKKAFLLPNGVDLQHWCCNLKGKLKGRISNNGAIVGYFGTLSHWLDKKLVVDMATRRPNWTFVFIGPRTDKGGLSPIFELANCIHIPEVNYYKLPELACDFDVCWMPFKASELTMSINPVKIYEYLAMGKPVVVPELPDLAELKNVLFVASNSNDWEQALEKAFAQCQDPKLVKQRQNKVKKYAWENIACDAIDMITKAGIVQER